ncbi:hypothetical protein COV21_01685 [Candidatus Woesearchaeota archaeon CG10_big_fil_rev_8_21_14_0_10_45_5]|nr:MAG: hypothetical protein COV21_01685 [Candidatus Woesearchaeota archaeon CG10_big_fil_rev_8_21_14_0_10_45_5]
MRQIRLGAVAFAVLLFTLGWVANSIYADISLNYYQNRELAAFYGNGGQVTGDAAADAAAKTSMQMADPKQGILDSVFKQPAVRACPADRVSENQIYVTGDKVILAIRNAEWASFTPTHSMEPVLNENSNAIEVAPENESDIKIGDIISYESEYADGMIIHRVVRIGYDEQGWYCTAKGDNNPSEDPGKIRFSQVRSVVVAIIY